jgi:hypothetical protein
MSLRELTVNKINTMSEEDLQNFVEKLDNFLTENTDPNHYVCEFGYQHGDFNQTTIDAMKEADEIIKNNSFRFKTVEEFWEALDADDTEDDEENE